LIFCEAILHIPDHCKGKPVERRGRKATGLRVEAVDHDSGVARMYNTKHRFYVHPAAWPFHSWARFGATHKETIVAADSFVGHEGTVA
jgi:hypothetical protein